MNKKPQLNRHDHNTVGDIIQYQSCLRVGIDDDINIAIEKMRNTRKFSAVVEDEGARPVGLLTARKILSNAFRHQGQANIWDQTSTTAYKNLKVRDVMIEQPICLDFNCSIENALQIMHSNDYRFMPVTHNGVTAGIIDIRDLFSKRFNQLQNAVDKQSAMISYFMGNESYGGSKDGHTDRIFGEIPI